MAKYQHVQQYCNNSEIEFKSEATDISSAFNEAAQASAEAFLLEDEFGLGSDVHEVQLTASESEVKS